MTQTPRPRPGLEKIAPYIPGVSQAPGVARVFKLSSNESPLGASPAAIAAMREASSSLHLYPDGGSTALRHALARRHGLEPERILCGCGSNELIGLVAQAYLDTGDEAVIPRYGFSEFEIVTRGNGGVPVMAPETGFTADVEAILAAVGPRTRIVFLANPNNPTGTFITGAEVRRLHVGLPSHVILLLDEAYAEYAEAPWESGLDMARGAQNIVVTRTFSKIFGLAAARVGWGYLPADMAEAVNRIRYPFNVSAAAQSAALAAMADEDFLQAARAYNEHWRLWLARELAASGLTTSPSAGNFLLAHLPRGLDATDVYQGLLARGVIVRPLAGYGLPSALRISVGTEEGNHALVSAFREVLKA
ncbi:histidinol-phosphate transaminase [Brevundimonas sp.]|uniref:histidinol-phosphate transaminase n=1 Tax=Brevundimonas sp. TaxID=1871086 RepID=UPI002EDADBBF